MAALRQLAASWTTRGMLNVNIDPESVRNLLDPIQYQVLSWQDCLRMARGEVPLQIELKTILEGNVWATFA